MEMNSGSEPGSLRDVAEAERAAQRAVSGRWVRVAVLSLMAGIWSYAYGTGLDKLSGWEFLLIALASVAFIALASQLGRWRGVRPARSRPQAVFSLATFVDMIAAGAAVFVSIFLAGHLGYGAPQTYAVLFLVAMVYFGVLIARSQLVARRGKR